MKMISLGIFILISAAHIVFILLQKERLRRMSKILIIPSLLAFYIAAAENPYVFPILALVFGWIGDILLINKRRRLNFKLGLVSFLSGHICYILAFVHRLWLAGSGAGEGLRFNPPAAFICIPLAAAAGIVIIRFIKPNKEMFLPVIIYVIGIEIMSFWAFELFVCDAATGGALVFAGSLCFIISDTVLGYYTFRKLTLAGSVLVMLFYIIAQTAITCGLMM